MSENIKAVFSKNLTNQLYIHNKTQADICKRMNVSSATASDWCNGKKLPRLDKIQSLCNWLDIEKSDLLEEKLEVHLDEYKKKTSDPDVQEVIELFKKANPDVQKAVAMALGWRGLN